MADNFIKIPDYPNYRFNPDTLEVKSIGRMIWMKRNNCYKYQKEKILKPNLHKQGYYCFALYNENGGKRFYRSWISWLVEYGELPPKDFHIDHKNADKKEDHIWNLQLLTPRENIIKGCVERGKKYPVGVHLHKQTGKYRSRITVSNKSIHLGLFKTPEEASNAYQQALREVCYR